MVRGTCDKCHITKDDNFYCFQQFSYFNNQLDLNCYTAKYPDFYDFIFDVVHLIQKCRNIDAVVTLLEHTPTSDAPTLDFGYSTVLHINGNHIQVVRDGKQLYEKYNKMYPTEDREIEYAISLNGDFNFRF